MSQAFRTKEIAELQVDMVKQQVKIGELLKVQREIAQRLGGLGLPQAYLDLARDPDHDKEMELLESQILRMEQQLNELNKSSTTSSHNTESMTMRKKMDFTS